MEGVWRSDIPSKLWVDRPGAGEHADGLGAGQRQSWDLQADSMGAGPKDRACLGSGDVEQENGFVD